MIGNRIRQLRERRKMTQADLSKILGIANTTISQYETEKRSVDDSIKIKIAEYFGVSVDYLLGRWDMLEKQINQNELASKFTSMAVFEKITCIEDLYDSNNVNDLGIMPREYMLHGEYFGYIIKNKDMSNRLVPGDIIVVRKQPILQSGDIGLILINHQEAQVRKYEITDSGIILSTFDGLIAPVEFTYSDISNIPITIVGKIVSSKSKF